MRHRGSWAVRLSWAAALVGAAFAGGAAPLSAQQATIVGHVTAKTTSEPVGSARVVIVGSSIAVETRQDGQYTIRNAPTGTIEVRVTRVGFTEDKKSVTVTAGQTVTVDFQLATAVVKLQEVVTTATGEQRKVELGNAISTLGNVSQQVEQSAVNNVADMLVSKAPGVFVRSPTMTGAAPVIQIRGLNSLSLTNNPIVIVDGIRYNSGAIGGGVGGTNLSFLNGIDPEDISDVEIVKGPSAATLYGTDAANGVIVITTKRGAVGNTKWTWFGEGGTVDDRNKYPTTYALWGHDPNSGRIKRCQLATMSATTCVADSVTSLNIPADSRISPLALGHRSDFGGQVSGGSEQVRYFIAADLENEIGTYQMPAFAKQWLIDNKTPPRDEWLRPEAYQKQNIRANLTASLSPTFDITVNSNFVKSDQRLPQVDNNVNGIGGAMYLTYGTNHAGLDYNPTGSLGEPLLGYARYTPASIFQYLTQQGIQRITGSSDVSWRPFSWMQNSGTVGVDLAARNFFQLCRFNECPAFSTNRLGFVSDNVSLTRLFTAKLNSTSSWNPKAWLNVKTTVGADYLNSSSQASNASGNQLPPGAQTVGSGAQKSASDQQLTATKTLGLYVQEQAAFRDKLFVTAAVRTDQNSAFGTNFQRVFYPKLSVSWIASEESFFPKWNWMNQLRVRGAWGESGVQPGATSSLQTYSSTTVNVLNTPTAGLVAAALGNPNLKPETAAEFEGGFDLRALNSRINLELTYYTRQTSDALISLPIAPSTAPSSTSVLANLASVKNAGIEAQVTGQVIDWRRFGWDVTVSASHNSNKVVSLGNDPSGKPNKTIGTGTLRDSVGLPVNAIFLRPYSYTDANGDGIIQTGEVTVQQNVVYDGYAVPRDIVSVQNGFDLFGRLLRINTLLDYSGGHDRLNNTLSFICQQSPQPCAENQIASTPLWQQARAVANNYGTVINGTKYTTTMGYYESGQYWRLREVSATLQLPKRIAGRLFRSGDATLSFQARNLHVWTKFMGVDPEASYGTGDVATDFITQPPPTYFILRLNLHY